jgi:hypothetical protein
MNYAEAIVYSSAMLLVLGLVAIYARVVRLRMTLEHKELGR